MKYDVMPLTRLIEQFARLPGIGRKTAQRLAFYVLNLPHDKAKEFADTILEAHEKIKPCSVCQNLTDREVCQICSDPARDHSMICVVEGPRDVMAIEKTREYQGLYHVLHGLISPMNQKGPDDLTIRQLLARIQQGGVQEVIMATNPTVEGETTAMYIARLLKPLGVKVTRLASGIPMKLPCSGLWKVVRNYKQEVSVKTDASFFIRYNVLKSICKLYILFLSLHLFCIFYQ